ncbi:hypothetical protein KFE94_09600 [bacterium SCSIO 12643]|nr:hypothetical protein KFE94_09600 [bacterium SCSIO 12643]
MRLFFYVFAILGLSYSIHLKGQDTITLLGGNVIVAKVTSVDSINVNYSIQKKKGLKDKFVASEMVFDIKYENGSVDTLYYKSEELDHYLTPDEMYLFILGEQDAKADYHPKMTAVLGVVVGAGLGYLLRDGFYVAGVPLVYTIGAGVSKIDIKNINQRSTTILSHPAYQEGYIKVARSKKAFNALAGSLIGTVIGVGIGKSLDQ